MQCEARSPVTCAYRYLSCLCEAFSVTLAVQSGAENFDEVIPLKIITISTSSRALHRAYDDAEYNISPTSDFNSDVHTAYYYYVHTYRKVPTQIIVSPTVFSCVRRSHRHTRVHMYIIITFFVYIILLYNNNNNNFIILHDVS